MERPSTEERVPRRRRELHARRRRPVRLHARRARGRLRPVRVPGDQDVARPRRRAARARHDRRLSVRVPLRTEPDRLAASRQRPDRGGESCVRRRARRGLLLRIDDTDPSASSQEGRRRSWTTSRWLGVGWDEGPRAAERAGERVRRRGQRGGGWRRDVRDDDGSLRLGGTTLLRADGSATYQLASVADDLELGITHVIRGSDHRPNEEVQRRIARALGGELPEVIHHGLLLGEDGKKLSKRHGHASVADLRESGIPAAAVRCLPRRARSAPRTTCGSTARGSAGWRSTRSPR